jgi:hypothetical protein
MVLNKLKSRSIKRSKRAKHGKYSKRKGRVRVYHQKYKKHYTRKYGKQIQRRIRSKKGGELTLNIPNMNTPVTILYRYFARITKPNEDSFREDDKQEQITMYTQQDTPNSIFIARCPSKDCSTETGAQIMKIDDKSLKKDASKNEYSFSSDGIKYKIKIDDGIGGVGVTLLDVFDAYTRLKKSEVKEAAEEPAKAPVEPVSKSETLAKAPVKTPVVPVDTSEAPETTPTDVKTPQMSEKNKKFQDLMDSINFLQPGIDDIIKMLKVTNETTCSFFCNPDECDKTMLEKLRQKYMEKIKNNNSVSETDDAIGIFYDTLDENLFLILENFYVQSQILTKEKLKELFDKCHQTISYSSLTDSRSTRKNLHGIINTLYKKIRDSIQKNDSYLQQNFENMKKLLDLLNSMTPANMKKLLDLLDYMTPANMKKLLDLLDSMTPANMKKLLQLLNSMTPENIGIILQALNTKFNISNSGGVVLANSDHSMGLLLSYHLKLDAESMSKLLDFYSFSEIKKNVDTNRKIVRYDIICHKYKGEQTPLLKSISIGKEDSSTCKAIEVLNESIEIFTSFLKNISEYKKINVYIDVRHEYDENLFKADDECRHRHYQGGGKRKTLKKKRLVNSRRKTMIKQ